MPMISKIGGSIGYFSLAAVCSAMLYPPGDVAKQFTVAGIWYVAGLVTAVIWLRRS